MNDIHLTNYLIFRFWMLPSNCLSQMLFMVACLKYPKKENYQFSFTWYYILKYFVSIKFIESYFQYYLLYYNTMMICKKSIQNMHTKNKFTSQLFYHKSFIFWKLLIREDKPCWFTTRFFIKLDFEHIW